MTDHAAPTPPDGAESARPTTAPPTADEGTPTPHAEAAASPSGTVHPDDTADRLSARLHRVRDGRMVGGVCAGLASAWRIDPLLLRLGFVAVAVLFFPFGALLYVLFWVLMPEGDAR
jgi:phage shock protein PspC (stress-responsive transcriptional regulator)